ncbi:MAG: 16S rRNA (adenine(1518)-N(6)/adenine(1519)-N(6))-dimethyltransferase RsmA [Candidatus Omnitrophica bacterium]|nr:16S rRNA (adenine(1518)-N(6)/adenine(1519)-N(6))-dimethyltransferase RsmA [Candidatus Omnitrophota bacterium]
MLTKNQIREIFKRYDFAPLKRLGENYLIDSNIKDKIIAAAGVSANDTVLEIGPGLGALTSDLASAADSVIAVEKDGKAVEILSEIAGSEFPNLKIINGDILEFDLKCVAGKKLTVVGNLPYYITTPVIEYLFTNKRFVKSAVIMVQKEVALRLLAKPGTRDYGSLSCFVQYHSRPEYIYTVKRTCFYPAPKVDSAILRLEILDSPSVDVESEELFFRVVRGSFNQRRKSIINSLSREAVLDVSKEKLAAILKRAGIDPAARPETLSLVDFAKLTNAAVCGNL